MIKSIKSQHQDQQLLACSPAEDNAFLATTLTYLGILIGKAVL